MEDYPHGQEIQQSPPVESEVKVLITEGTTVRAIPKARRKIPERISRDALFIGIARLFGERSTCLRAKVGAIAVFDGRIIASGYVGSVAGAKHCLDIGCLIEGGGCIRTVHAEANVVAFSSKAGVSLRGCSLYSTHQPCANCSKLIINSGICRVYYETQYRNEDGLRLLRDSGVIVEQLNIPPSS